VATKIVDEGSQSSALLAKKEETNLLLLVSLPPLLPPVSCCNTYMLQMMQLARSENAIDPCIVMTSCE
jgi:hypothetical protein